MYQFLPSPTAQEISDAQGRICLGLCCINNTLRTKKIFTNRTCKRATFSPEKAISLSTQNCKDVLTLLEWNQRNGIKHFRLSSDLFPHFHDDQVEKYQWTPEIIDALEQAGDYANSNSHRITMHPGQFNVVGTPNPKAYENTVNDLTLHAQILDCMKIDQNSGVLCVHGGGVYGDKESTKRRWIEQFDDLPSSVKARLAIENCEKNFSIQDCLDISEATGIPTIIDTHHYVCYELFHPNEPSQLPIEELIERVVEDWDARNTRALFHISDPKTINENRMRCCDHHDFVENIPACLLRCAATLDRCFDIEVEAKKKEAAIEKLVKKYSTMFV
jgi:UV DNA damage endonuclease